MINQWASLDPSYCLEISFPIKGSQSFLDKWLIPDPGQRIYKMNLEHLSIPDARKLPKITRVMLKSFSSQFGEILLAKDKTI